MHSKNDKAPKGEEGFPLEGFELRPSGNLSSYYPPEG
jgi:hypothetical protein